MVLAHGYGLHCGGLGLGGRVESLTWGGNATEIADKATFTIGLNPFGMGTIEEHVQNGAPVRVFADDQQVFIGRVFRRGYLDGDKTLLRCTAYDPTIYLVKSEDELMFDEEVTAREFFQRIASDWSLPLGHLDLPEGFVLSQSIFRKGTISKHVYAVLDEIRLVTGVSLIPRATMDNGTLEIVQPGWNSVKYLFTGDNCETLSDEEDIEDLVTKVIAVGVDNQTDDERYVYPPLATGAGSKAYQDRYGTLQRIVQGQEVGDEPDDVVDAARQILLDQGMPRRVQRIRTVDIPTTRKGDKAGVRLGSMNGEFFFTSVEHDAGSGTMTCEVDTSGTYRRRVPVKKPETPGVWEPVGPPDLRPNPSDFLPGALSPDRPQIPVGTPPGP